jgi:hypothetical protein
VAALLLASRKEATMKVAEVKPGQIWRSNQKGGEWLVTKAYREAFDTYVVMRRIGGSESEVRRLKVERSSEGLTIPGFTLIEG